MEVMCRTEKPDSHDKCETNSGLCLIKWFRKGARENSWELTAIQNVGEHFTSLDAHITWRQKISADQ